MDSLEIEDDARNLVIMAEADDGCGLVAILRMAWTEKFSRSPHIAFRVLIERESAGSDVRTSAATSPGLAQS